MQPDRVSGRLYAISNSQSGRIVLGLHACSRRRPLAGPRAPVPSSCAWSFRLRSSARSSSPTDWERYVSPASLRVRKNPSTKNSVSALLPFVLTKYHRRPLKPVGRCVRPMTCMLVAESACPTFRRTLRSCSERRSTFDAIKSAHAGALIVLSDSFFTFHSSRIAELAAKYRIPTIYGHSRYILEGGGLMSYGPSLADISRRGASYVDKILKGAVPADLPVEQPIKFDLVINLKAAKALALNVPPALLARAD